ncbi:MAG: helix-turn-helix transcriptional regulator [Saprospiraceae bacterium]|nr:helix-turn-helix transcriptional regulator [Saprospiraceae bacterium]
MNNTYDFLTNRPNEFQQIASNDLLFVHYICPQIDHYLYLYSHFNQISFTLGGDKTFHHGLRSWNMTEHTTVFAKKGAWKQEIGTKGWEILSFYFPDDFLCLFFNEYRELWPLKSLPATPSDMLIPIKINEITRAFFYSFLPYFEQQSRPPKDLLTLKFKELLFIILSNPANAELLSYINRLGYHHKPPLFEIMEANFHFNLSIAEFARLAQRSVSTFKRDFKQDYQTTPGKWLLQKRIAFATLLLNTSTKNISEIANDSGFENPTHFSRVFKEVQSVSPLQFRKRISAASHF